MRLLHPFSQINLYNINLVSYNIQYRFGIQNLVNDKLIYGMIINYFN